MLNPLKIISKFITSSNQKTLNKLRLTVNKVNLLENEISNLSDEDFPTQTTLLKEKLKSGETIQSILPQAFSLVRDASKRVRGERQFDFQIMRGIIIHDGNIPEMKT